MSELRISDLADRLGVTTRTLRYYEEIGLITPERSAANNRIYSEAAQEKATLVTRLRQADISLADIAIALARRHKPDDADVVRELSQRLDVLDSERRRIHQLLDQIKHVRWHDGDCTFGSAANNAAGHALMASIDG